MPKAKDPPSEGVESGVARCWDRKRYEEAEPFLLSGYEGLKARKDKIPAAGKLRPQEALERLVQLYEETERPDEAALWKKELAELNQAGE